MRPLTHIFCFLKGKQDKDTFDEHFHIFWVNMEIYYDLKPHNFKIHLRNRRPAHLFEAAINLNSCVDIMQVQGDWGVRTRATGTDPGLDGTPTAPRWLGRVTGGKGPRGWGSQSKAMWVGQDSSFHLVHTGQLGMMGAGWAAGRMREGAEEEEPASTAWTGCEGLFHLRAWCSHIKGDETPQCCSLRPVSLYPYFERKASGK